jgi:hypothetical protein
MVPVVMGELIMKDCCAVNDQTDMLLGGYVICGMAAGNRVPAPFGPAPANG